MVVKTVGDVMVPTSIFYVQSVAFLHFEFSAINVSVYSLLV